ncbi:hypothetical protein T8T21_16855 (plasmid) [Limimaricola variabilis]|uniref:hypothetical protein n=1 Tax=Limimaricola variabilis TaxID=1492771 RepID=UPI002AC8B0AD|nr:hypothetical protein [Limimaricola variabilis]WPY96180.1 hypothetical protein T8T21_16855 [Limimaricola variabilis]
MIAFTTCPTIDYVRDGRPMLPRAAATQGLASYIEAAWPSSVAVSLHVALHGDLADADILAGTPLSDAPVATAARQMQAYMSERRA